MKEVIYYQCESCEHIFENSSVIENCFGCGVEICSNCGMFNWYDDEFYCNSCIDKKESEHCDN